MAESVEVGGQWIGPAQERLAALAAPEYGRTLRAPIGPLHWAGAETAAVWNGCMDGAVRSGERAAVEVRSDLDHG